MDSRTDRDIVFLPIKPQFARQIVSGEKKVEFRKKNFPLQAKIVVVYSSTPDQSVLGWFDVKCVKALSKNAAWATYKDVGGIAKKDFMEYYQDAGVCHVIEIQEFHAVENNMHLLAALGITIPQSYCYLSPEKFNMILEAA